MEREKVTRAQVDALARTLGFGAIICDFGNVDYSMGRGVLKGNDRCLWTKDGHRITIGVSPDGGIIASLGRQPDPERPTTPYSEVEGFHVGGCI